MIIVILLIKFIVLIVDFYFINFYTHHLFLIINIIIFDSIFLIMLFAISQLIIHRL